MLDKSHSQRHIFNPWLRLSFMTIDYLIILACTISIERLSGEGENKSVSRKLKESSSGAKQQAPQYIT